MVTKPAKGGPLSLVPTGAGEVEAAYARLRKLRLVLSWLPDGKQLLASGIEAGHGARDYLIDVSSGDAKAVTPEGICRCAPFARRPEHGGARARWKLGNLAAGWERSSSDPGLIRATT